MREVAPTLASVIGVILTVGLALSIYFAQEQDWVTAWHVLVVAAFAVLFQGAGIFLRRRQEDSIISLQRKVQAASDLRDRDDEQRRRAIEQKAYELLEECDALNDHTRLTVYQHEPRRQTFVRLSRVSNNPRLEEPGRAEYPDDQGLIRSAWSSEVATKFSLPKDPQEWAEEVSMNDIPIEEAQQIKMKSRSLVGVRIDYRERNVGVLIMESKNPQGVNSKHADKLKGHSAFGELAGMLAVTPKLPPLDDEQRQQPLQ